MGSIPLIIPSLKNHVNRWFKRFLLIFNKILKHVRVLYITVEYIAGSRRDDMFMLKCSKLQNSKLNLIKSKITKLKNRRVFAYLHSRSWRTENFIVLIKHKNLQQKSHFNFMTDSL